MSLFTLFGCSPLEEKQLRKRSIDTTQASAPLVVSDRKEQYVITHD